MPRATSKPPGTGQIPVRYGLPLPASGTEIARTAAASGGDAQPGGSRPAGLPHLPQAHWAELRRAAADPAHVRSICESCLLTGPLIESKFEITEYVRNRATDHRGF